MRRVRGVILDGWHRASVIYLNYLLPEINVPKISTVGFAKEDDCPSRMVSENSIYKLTFAAVDGEVGLYSLSGRSSDFVDNRDSVHPSVGGNIYGHMSAVNYFIKVIEKS